MVYHLKTGENLNAGIERIVREEIDKALAYLRGEGNTSQEEAVHEVRKSLKKLRAVVRLVRDEIGKDVYQLENAWFRDTGRLLSEIRDLNVHIETLDHLVKHFADSIAPNGFADIRAALVTQHDLGVKQFFSEHNPMESAQRRLETAQERLKTWPRIRDDWEAIAPSFQRIYKQGHKGLKVAYHHNSVESFHEWRKRVKDLWYHLSILEVLWPTEISAMADSCKELSDYLGDDHDLAILRELLQEKPELSSHPRQTEALRGLIDQRRITLQRAAHRLGHRVYAEAPHVFVQRIGTYWQQWKQDRDVPVQDKPSAKM